MLSSAALQIIAILTMTVDHLGFYLFPNCEIFRIIGRIAFPLFAFLLAEGFMHTRSRSAYFYRILLAAVITQPLCYISDGVTQTTYAHNVLFTLDFAFVALMMAERGGYFLIGVPLIALLASALNCEYGVFGVLLVVGFYYARKIFTNNRIIRLMAQACILAAMMLSLADYDSWGVQKWALLAIVPIALYSGKKGRRLPRCFTYVYYPAHLLVLVILRLVFF